MPVTDRAGGGEQFGEMLALSMVDHIQDHVRLEMFVSILNRGQVGGGIQERTIGFAHDHRRIEAFDKNAQGPIAGLG